MSPRQNFSMQANSSETRRNQSQKTKKTLLQVQWLMTFECKFSATLWHHLRQVCAPSLLRNVFSSFIQLLSMKCVTALIFYSFVDLRESAFKIICTPSSYKISDWSFQSACQWPSFDIFSLHELLSLVPDDFSFKRRATSPRNPT